MTNAISEYILDADELSLFSKRSLESRIDFLPGAVYRDGRLHLFGGLSQETAYMLNGANISHRIRGRSAVHIIPEALQTVSVSTLPYEASFGGATGGVVNARLREGGERWSGSLHYRSDAFNSQDEALLGSYGFGEQNTVLTLGGPLGGNLRFFAAAEYQRLSNPSRRIYSPFSINSLVDENPANPDNGEIVDLMVNELETDNQKNNFLALNSNLTWSGKVASSSVQFGLTDRRSDLNATPLLNMFNNRTLDQSTNSWYIATDLTLNPTPNSRFSVKGSITGSKQSSRDGFFEDDFFAWFDSTQNMSKGVTFVNPISPEPDYLLRLIPFKRNGTPLSQVFQKSSYQRRQLNLNLKRNFPIAEGSTAGLVFGIDLQQEQSRYFNINARSMLSLLEPFNTTDPEEIPPAILVNAARVSAYGFDRLGNETDVTNVNSSLQPTIVSPYTQLEFQHSKFNLKAGLRYAKYNSDTFSQSEFALQLPPSQTRDEATGLYQENSFKENETENFLLPRFSGEFMLSPELSAWLGLGWYAQQGNEYTGLAPSSFANKRQMSIGSMFKRKTIGCISAELINSDHNPIFNSSDGFNWNTTQLILSYVSTFSGLSEIRGTYTYTSSDRVDDDALFFLYPQFRRPLEGSPEDPMFNSLFLSSSPYYFDVKHQIDLIFAYTSNSRNSILKDIQLFIHPQLKSGVLYPPSEFGGFRDGYFFAGIANRSLRPPLSGDDYERTPFTYQIDLSIAKSWKFHNHTAISLGLDIINLLNTSNAINVYPLSGNAKSVGIETDPLFNELARIEEGGEPVLFQSLNTLNGESFRAATGKELYDTPRQVLVRVGIEL